MKNKLRNIPKIIMMFLLVFGILFPYKISDANIYSNDKVAIYNNEKNQENVVDIGLEVEKNKEDTLKPKSPLFTGQRKQLTQKEKENFKEARRNTEKLEGIDPLAGDDLAFDISAFSVANDTRTLVSNPTQYPYYMVCKLLIEHQDGSMYIGSGFAVGNSLCATARHCITQQDGQFVKSITAYYGYNNGSYTNKFSNVSSYIYQPDYTYGETTNDYAFIVWNTKTVSQTGCFGLSDDLYTNMTLKTAGYPGDMYSGERMISGYGSLNSFDNTNLYMGMYCAGGQSGSPIYVDGPYAKGVLTHSAGATTVCRRFGGLISWLKNNGYA